MRLTKCVQQRRRNTSNGKQQFLASQVVGTSSHSLNRVLYNRLVRGMPVSMGWGVLPAVTDIIRVGDLKIGYNACAVCFNMSR